MSSSGEEEEGQSQNPNGAAQTYIQLPASPMRINHHSCTDDAASSWSHRFYRSLVTPLAHRPNLKCGAFRKKLGHFLDSDPRWQWIVLVLTLIDVFAVVIELLISEGVIVQTEASEKAAEALHIISLSILGFFCLELALLLFAFSYNFFKHFWYMLDLVVVVSSLVVETIFKDEAVGLIILLRIWRVVRIVHGFAVVVEVRHEHYAEQLRKVEEKHIQIESQLKREIDELKRRCAMLTDRLRSSMGSGAVGLGVEESELEAGSHSAIMA